MVEQCKSRKGVVQRPTLACFFKTNKQMEKNYKEIYLKVLDFVSKGNTISKACKIVKIDRTSFYKNISNEQKKELMNYKATTLIYGTPGNFSINGKDFINFNI